MPFVLLIMGLILIVTGFQNTYKQFGKLVAGDFTGPNNFIYWFLAIAVVGAIGYVKPLEPFSRGFMVLIVLSIVLTKNHPNIVASFQKALGTESNAVDNTIGAPVAGGSSGGGSGSGSGFGGLDLSSLNSFSSDLSTATTVASFFGL